MTRCWLPPTLLALPTILLSPSSLRANDWPQLRGPTGQGFASERDLPTTWNAKGENILWKVELPKSSAPFSSPIVRKNRVYLTFTGDKDPKTHWAMAFAADTGKPLWRTDVPPGPWKGGGKNAYPTPCADDNGHVYCLFGSAVIVCLDSDGNILWRHELKQYAFDVAIGSSPVLWKDLVILLCDQTGKASNLLALDRKTGQVRYDVPRPDMGFAHSTPVVATINGVEQLVVMVSKGMQGIDPASGKVLWQCPGSGDTSSPAVSGTIAYADGGRGGPGIAVDLADWKPDPAASTKLQPKWQTEKLKESLGSPVVARRNLYRQVGDTLYCWELATGKQVYAAQGKLAGGTNRISPFVTADGLIYFVSAGRSFIVRAADTFELVALNDLQDANDASAAVADGRIYVRGAKYLWCVGKHE